jgi:hypothetical protein
MKINQRPEMIQRAFNTNKQANKRTTLPQTKKQAKYTSATQ